MATLSRLKSSLHGHGLVPTCAPVPNRALLSLTGQHAAQFLNGILTTSVNEPCRGAFYASLLHAQGRVLYDVFVYPERSEEGGYLIEYDPRSSDAPPLSSLLKRYILRSKVKIRDVSEEYDVWASWNNEDDVKMQAKKWRWSRSGAVEPVWQGPQWPWGGETGRWLRDVRAEGMGYRHIVPKGDRPHQASSHQVQTAQSYTIHRILHAVPEGITELVPMSAFPMESNLDIMGGLDFRKGCYVGQELTVRTYHTGTIRKRIFPVQIYPLNSPSSLSPSANPLMPILSPADIQITQKPPESSRVPRPRGTNKLLTSVQGLGLALMRLEHVEAVERGELEMQVSGYALKHWLPEWWPQKGVDEVE